MRLGSHLLPPLRLDLSAKVRWRMRFDRNPLLIRVQDKFAVRAYAAERGVATAPLLFQSDRPEELPFDTLPPRYLIKANHGCGWNLLGFDGELYDFRDGRALVRADGRLLDPGRAAAYKLTREQAVSRCREWLLARYCNREWAYQQIAPRIVVEELLEAPDGGVLYDHRFYTFRGEVHAINLGSGAFRRDRRNVFLDPDWNPIPLTRYAELPPDILPPRPARLEAMLEAARQLGGPLEFVRIDLYDTTRGIILGEMTVYPESGSPGSPSGCPVFDRRLGSHWRLGPWRGLQALAWEQRRWLGNLAGGLGRALHFQGKKPAGATRS